jgi:hypothetical protein
MQPAIEIRALRYGSAEGRALRTRDLIPACDDKHPFHGIKPAIRAGAVRRGGVDAIAKRRRRARTAGYPGLAWRHGPRGIMSVPTARVRASVKLSGVEPQARPTDVLGCIANHKITKLDELMLWGYAQKLNVKGYTRPSQVRNAGRS